MSTVWITGARGFIGRHLARKLAEQGSTVVGIGHGAWPASEAAQWGVSTWVNGSVTGSNLHALARSGGPPTTVFHLAGGASVAAAIANPLEDFSRTVLSTASLLEWLRQAAPATRLVAVSSAAIYGAGHTGPIAEDAPARPYSPYGYHKYMMEQLCSSYGASFRLHSVVLRLFSVYGAGLKKQLLWDVCSRLAATPETVELGGTGEELRDWVEIRDAAAALAAAPAMAEPAAPVLNIGSGVAISVKRIASLIQAAWQPRPNAASVRFSGFARAGDPFSLQADTRRMAARGLRCTIAPEQGVADYVRWFQTAGPAPS